MASQLSYLWLLFYCCVVLAILTWILPNLIQLQYFCISHSGCTGHAHRYFWPSQETDILAHVRVWFPPGSNTTLNWARRWETYAVDTMLLDKPSVSNQCAEYFNEVTILQAFKYTTNPSATGCFKIIAVMTYQRVNVNRISSWPVSLIFDYR
jgi:hypothetical protein